MADGPAAERAQSASPAGAGVVCPVNYGAINLAHAGSGSYDSLSEPEQAIAREEWAERATTLRRALDYGAEFTEAGESYSELDENGGLVVHPARG